MSALEFEAFPKIARWSREVTVTEKLDGTNAAVLIVDGMLGESAWPAVAKVGNLDVYAQSRSRFITQLDDNFGFAKWVAEHAEELCDRTRGLGVGRHFGEWWGAGIQRRYAMSRKHFSLLNTSRWTLDNRPLCCDVVPVLYQGPLEIGVMESCVSALAVSGSIASPGFMDPEGCVMFHTAANLYFKKTLKKDEVPKALAERAGAPT